LIAKYGGVGGQFVTATSLGPAGDDKCCFIYTVVISDEKNGSIDPDAAAKDTTDAINSNGAADGLSVEPGEDSSNVNSASSVVVSFVMALLAMIVVLL